MCLEAIGLHPDVIAGSGSPTPRLFLLQVIGVQR
jgi:hypothetical protein